MSKERDREEKKNYEEKKNRNSKQIGKEKKIDNYWIGARIWKKNRNCIYKDLTQKIN